MSGTLTLLAQYLMCMRHDDSRLTLQLLMSACGLRALKRITQHVAAWLWHVCQCSLSSNKSCCRSSFGSSLFLDVGAELATAAA